MCNLIARRCRSFATAAEIYFSSSYGRGRIVAVKCCLSCDAAEMVCLILLYLAADGDGDVVTEVKALLVLPSPPPSPPSAVGSWMVGTSG